MVQNLIIDTCTMSGKYFTSVPDYKFHIITENQLNPDLEACRQTIDQSPSTFSVAESKMAANREILVPPVLVVYGIRSNSSSSLVNVLWVSS